jgi:PIN domain nuclease of toxin-antitoxin system
VPDGLTEVLEVHRFAPLAISFDHAVAAGALPHHHRDPFDRMLIAQAQVESLTVVSVDAAFSAYAVDLLPV